jgi:hypothetical protein
MLGRNGDAADHVDDAGPRDEGNRPIESARVDHGQGVAAHTTSNRYFAWLGAMKIDAQNGLLIIRDGDGRDSKTLDARFALLDLGANGNEGDRGIRDNAGTFTFRVPGDMLTNSTHAGHAMRVDDDTATGAIGGTSLAAPDRGTSPGTILGQELRPLPSGTGLVPVLVALQ